jgi:hypothetical protein
MASRGMTIPHASPSGRQSKVSEPASCPRTMRSITLVPKPRRDGARTVGPPVSVHASRRCPSARRDHSSETRPPRTERAPYLTALVASSWSTIAIDWAAGGASIRPGPSIRTGEPSWCRWGARTSAARRARSAPSQWLSDSMECACAIALMRPSIIAVNSPTVAARVKCTMDRMTVRRFLARWSTSRARRCRRASASLRSVISRAIFEAPTTLPSVVLIGDTVSEMSTRLPSLRRRTVS